MEHESLIRLSVFFGLFAIFALAESFAPRRKRALPRSRRWLTNIGLVFLGSGTIKLLPLVAVGAALDAGTHRIGLFNLLDWPAWTEIVLSIIILDLIIWLQHFLTHKIPVLWRLHRVHHADRDFDVTTALRFHPVEIALSMGIKIVAVYALGPPVVAVVLFEVILNGTAMFNHTNWRLPHAIDAVLRLVLVTPDMHRVHHSAKREEHDSNYGFSLSVWDRIFRTYTPQPSQGHDAMTIGLQWQDDRPARIGWSLALPFFRS